MLFLLEGSLTTSGITYTWLKLVTYGLSVMLNSLKLSWTISVTNTIYMLFYKRSTRWKHLRDIGLSEWMPSILNRFFLKTFHVLLTSIYFYYLFYSFAFVSCCFSVSWYWSCLVCSGLAYEIYGGGGPSMYINCVVCYHVIVAHYVRSVGHVFAYFYTLDDDSEHPMDYETCLLPKVFP